MQQTTKPVKKENKQNKEKCQEKRLLTSVLVCPSKSASYKLLSEDDKQFIKEQLHDYRNKKAGEADMTQQITTGKHDFLTSTKTTLDFTDIHLTQQTWTDKLQYTPTKAFNFTTLTDNGPQTLSTMTSTNTFPTFTTVTPQTTDKWLTKFNGLHTATSTYTQQTSTPQTDITLTQTNLPAPNWTDITADIIFKKIEEVNSKVDMIMSFWGATKKKKKKKNKAKSNLKGKKLCLLVVMQ
ncbi:hypothetical protein OS493_001859 [Desmophyllum pertusum]|uniref:Uncharacterized protein n=1 Tax=Desmophyllum pertusum TaxID=174260 RepID=A0A9W9Z4M5_9CNID|nr:hypothetical protein OS493_001859 [Desmophyllum pertusum]